jgi:hypothetical protein
VRTRAAACLIALCVTSAGAAKRPAGPDTFRGSPRVSVSAGGIMTSPSLIEIDLVGGTATVTLPADRAAFDAPMGDPVVRPLTPMALARLRALTVAADRGGLEDAQCLRAQQINPPRPIADAIVTLTTARGGRVNMITGCATPRTRKLDRAIGCFRNADYQPCLDAIGVKP